MCIFGIQTVVQAKNQSENRSTCRERTQSENPRDFWCRPLHVHLFTIPFIKHEEFNQDLAQRRQPNFPINKLKMNMIKI